MKSMETNSISEGDRLSNSNVKQVQRFSRGGGRKKNIETEQQITGSEHAEADRKTETGVKQIWSRKHFSKKKKYVQVLNRPTDRWMDGRLMNKC